MANPSPSDRMNLCAPCIIGAHARCVRRELGYCECKRCRAVLAKRVEESHE